MVLSFDDILKSVDSISRYFIKENIKKMMADGRCYYSVDKSGDTVIWVQIDGFDTYYVSHDGRVRSEKKDGSFIDLKANYNGNKVKCVNLYKDKKLYSKAIHLLMARMFFPSFLHSECTIFLDDDKDNVTLSNIRWATRSDAMRHAFMCGRFDNRGSKHGRHKLTEKDVEWIRKHRKEYTKKELASKFNISISGVWYATSCSGWTHVECRGNVHNKSEVK